MTDRTPDMTAHERLRQLHADAPGGPWFPIVNDLIGGWSVANRDAPMSQIDTRPGSGDYVTADFVTEQQATLIATLRNVLPQLANLAEAADAVAWRRGLTTAERYALIGDLHDALADLEQALNQ